MKTETMKETEAMGGVPKRNSWDAAAVLAKFLSLFLPLSLKTLPLGHQI